MFLVRSVCLSVRRITEKVVNGFLRNFSEGYGMAQGPMSSILVTIRITVRIRESVPYHDSDPGRTGVRRRSVLSEYF